MPQKEATFNRDLKYSQWHRYPNLGKRCYAINIDYVEVRNGKIVAFMEIAETSTPLSQVSWWFIDKWKAFHQKVLMELYDKTGVEPFIVVHNATLSQFKVFCLSWKEERLFSEEEFKTFLETCRWRQT